FNSPETNLTFRVFKKELTSRDQHPGRALVKAFESPGITAPRRLPPNTELGWILGGPFSTYSNKISSTGLQTSCNNLLSFPVLEIQIKKFWEIEEGDNKIVSSLEELFCENHFKENVKMDHKGRFCVKLPLKYEPPELGSSYDTALRRFMALEAKFDKRPLFKNEYSKINEEYITLDI
ncbi:hypothetical protein ILUMI_17779, partial [Ignelater luminosus]